MRRSIRTAVVVALFALTGSAVRAQAPAPLPTAEAAKFMGAWVMTLESPQGPFSMTLTVSDNAGNTAAALFEISLQIGTGRDECRQDAEQDARKK